MPGFQQGTGKGTTRRWSTTVESPMPQPSLAHRRLSLLGGFELACDGVPLDLSGAGQRVLAYLALHTHQRPVRRASVAEQLWADAAAQQASSSLRSVLWRLPRPHGHKLVTTTSASDLRLAPDIGVDLWLVEEAAEVVSEVVSGVVADEPLGTQGEAGPAGPVDQLSALTLDLLPGWDESWLVVEQEAYRQTRMHHLEHLAAVLRRAGRYAAALRAALTAVRCEPLRESAHRCVIEVHLAEGNPSEALRQYDTYRLLLADELGLPPSPAIRTLVAPLLGRPVDQPARRTCAASYGGHLSSPSRR
jgi:DNA-binding SARP family transcriptional activator